MAYGLLSLVAVILAILYLLATAKWDKHLRALAHTVALKAGLALGGLVCLSFLAALVLHWWRPFEPPLRAGVRGEAICIMDTTATAVKDVAVIPSWHHTDWCSTSDATRAWVQEQCRLRGTQEPFWCGLSLQGLHVIGTLLDDTTTAGKAARIRVLPAAGHSP